MNESAFDCFVSLSDNTFYTVNVYLPWLHSNSDTTEFDVSEMIEKAFTLYPFLTRFLGHEEIGLSSVRMFFRKVEHVSEVNHNLDDDDDSEEMEWDEYNGKYI